MLLRTHKRVPAVTSEALRKWQIDASTAFDEIEHAHRAVGGAKPGRRFVTQQLNYAYVTLLAARFQGYARELHTQTADAIANGVNPDYRMLLVTGLTDARALDRANAHPNVIAESFYRFGFEIWQGADEVRTGKHQRRKKLRALIAWRNAIAHDEVDAKLATGNLEPRSITLDVCQRWRSSLNVLTYSLDVAAARKCEELGFPRPW